MRKFDVTGMSCAACSARVEKAVSKVDGVTSCTVSLLTNSMSVEGSASDDAIVAAVTSAGYGATLQGSKKPESKSPKDIETPKLIRRLLWSIGILLILMYLSMGHMLWNVPLPGFLRGNPVGLALAQLLLTVAIMILNGRFFTSGFKALWNRGPNMDSLVALGAGAAFLWSVTVLFRMTADPGYAHEGLMNLYFESAGMILTLITVGKMLEARSKGKTTDALKSLMDLAPKTACVLREGREMTVPVEEVRKGDVFLVRPGEHIPVDGRVLEGVSAVNESALTGESIPVDKEPGHLVSAGTINQSGFLKCEAARVGEDTTLSQIIRMVADASATKAPIAKLADKVSGVFVPTVIAIALVTTTVWLLLGRDLGFALARGISVLVISCPCALGLATPVAIMVGSGQGAKHGILFKTAASLEQAGRIQIVALDKTGTITQGKPKVTDVVPTQGRTEKELMILALALERKSEHPLARAIVENAEAQGISAPEVVDFRALPGNGLEASLNGKKLLGGSGSFLKKTVGISEDLLSQGEKLAEQGKTPLYFAENGEIVGLIAVADVVKPESKAAISQLRKLGLRVVMLTGDNERTAHAIAASVGVDEVIAGVLPQGKEKAIRKLCQQGKTAMVGDGINDAPALTAADLGIAIGAGTDVAIDAADVVLMKSSLLDVPAAIRLSRGTLRNIRENLFWAFFYNTVGIPIAAGALAPLGVTLDPMFGAAAMSLSSFCVVSNALRLNFLKIKPKEETNMVELKIEGMMCPHCEARVKAALEAIPGVVSATPSHKNGNAKVELSTAVDSEALVAAVTSAGYKVLAVH